MCPPYITVSFLENVYIPSGRNVGLVNPNEPEDDVEVTEESGSENVLHALEDMGLEREEANVYRLLLSKGVSTVGDISQYLSFSRTKVYGIFDRLLSKGWVKRVSEAPRMFAPVDPEKVLDLRRKVVSKAYKTAVGALKPVYNSIPVRMSEITVVRGLEAFKRIEEMIKSAEHEVKVVATVVPQSIVNKITDLLVESKKAGLDVKAILPPELVPKEAVDFLEASVQNIPNAGLLIIDGRQVYVGGIDTSGTGADMVGIVTENQALVTFNNILFDSLYTCDG